VWGVGRTRGRSDLVWWLVGDGAGFPIDRLDADENGNSSGRLVIPSSIALAVGNQAQSVRVSQTSVAKLQAKIRQAAEQKVPILSFVGNLNYVAVSILGGYLAIRGAITIGDIQAFIQYVRAFTQPIAQIANISNVLQQTAAAAERVFEFMDEEGRAIARTKFEQRRQGVREQHEFKVIRRDGRELWVLIAAHPQYDDDGHYCGVVSSDAAGYDPEEQLPEQPEDPYASRRLWF